MWGAEELDPDHSEYDSLKLKEYKGCDVLTSRTMRDIKNNNDKLQ